MTTTKNEKFIVNWLIECHFYEKTSFLVQKDPNGFPAVLALLKDSDKEVRWNTSVALASVGRKEGKPGLEEIFNLTNLRDFGFRSAKDMEQLLKAAKVAAVKLNDSEVITKMDELKKTASGDNPESKAIRSAL